MSKSRVNLKDPFVAGVLAFLVPGLGHLYQGRIFKACLYCACILGAFFFGLRVGDGRVVYYDWSPEKRTWAYTFQVANGLVALPAIAHYYLRKESLEDRLTAPLTARFEGQLGDQDGPRVVGDVSFQFQELPFPGWKGDLRGQMLVAGQPPKNIAGTLSDISIEPKCAPGLQRKLAASFDGQAEDVVPGMRSGTLRGSIPRAVWDAYLAPIQDRKFLGQSKSDLDQAHADLGPRFELGITYTMIAGLLNLLAILDAIDGPAQEKEDDEDDKSLAPGPTPAPAV